MPATTEQPVLLVAVDDDPTSLDLVAATVEQDGLEVVTFTDPVEALAIITQRRPQIVISDLMMPGLTGLELLEQVVRLDPTIDVLLLTAHYSTEAAVEAIQKGACDYLNKPINTRRLRARVDDLVAQANRRASAKRLDSELIRAHQFRGIVGRSPLMLDLYGRIERIAPHYRTALVVGPTGSGKELVARALHQASPVANGPLVVCNCAAIPENLVESEMFGHVRGAFTGATQDKAGLFEAAHNGTILLDELGEMPLNAQAKLLRVVQHQEVQRVGASTGKKINVRVVAATHRDLRSMVQERTFREDLFFRLASVQLRVPALSERKEDLPLLLRHFIEKYSDLYQKPLDGLTRKAEIAFTRYHWPGNVRELEGVIAAAAMMTDSTQIDVHDLTPQILEGEAPPQSDAAGGGDLHLDLEQIQIVHAHRVTNHFGGDKVQAAKHLGISRATLYRLLAKAPDQQP